MRYNRLSGMGDLRTSKICGLIFIILAQSRLYSQNLVPESGFEDYEQLPCTLNQYFIQDILKGWFQPITTSTDYWNTRIPSQCYLNPSDILQPRTGSGMVGLISAYMIQNFGTWYKQQYKEYIGTKLNSTLEQGALYHAGFFARNGVNRDTVVSWMRSNNLGMAFTDSLIFYDVTEDNPNHLHLTPQIEEKEIIGSEWKKVSGCILAERPLDFLYIGNFRSVDSTLIEADFLSEDAAFAYYYIDDAWVEKTAYDLSGLQNNRSICANNGKAELNASVNGAVRYLWQDGSTSPIKVVPVAGKYYVDIFFTECRYRHTFNLEDVPRVDLGNDSTLCYGETISLRNRFPGVSVTWSDGTSDSVKYVNGPGTYVASADTENCSLSDTISLEFIDCPGFVPNV